MIEIQGKYAKDVKIFTDNVEDEALSTIYDIANNKVFEDAKIRIMPDVHAGKGIVIGFTCPINKNFINPSHIGCDIGCGVEAIFFDKKIEAKDYPKFEREIKKAIPTGFNINEKSKFQMKEFIRFMNDELNKARYFINCVPSQWKSEDDVVSWCKSIGLEFGTFVKSIGTLGGGNHYIEYDENDEKNMYAVSIHTGSRNIGQKVFKKYSLMAKNQKPSQKEVREAIIEFKKTYNGDKKDLPKHIERICHEIKHRNPNEYLCGENLEKYLVDMVIAQAYAKYNRLIILRQIADIAKSINNAKVINNIASVHNYIDFIDGIIRKGAIRAHKDEKMIIPFNMRDGIAICVGKGNEDWNYSACHGAGRIMSRSQAKKQLSMDMYKDEMNGIYSTSISKATIDESPMAYKPTEEIINLIKPTCDIISILKPKINIKDSNCEE